MAEGVETSKGSLWYAILDVPFIVEGSRGVRHISGGECVWARRRLLVMMSLRRVVFCGIVEGKHNLSVVGVVGERIKSMLVSQRKASNTNMCGITEGGEVDSASILSIGETDEEKIDDSSNHKRRIESRHLSGHSENFLIEERWTVIETTCD